MEKHPITKDGFEKVKTDLDYLIKVEREDIKKAIQEARAHGDLKENAEYKAAKEKQSLIEGRISYLQSILNNCNIIDVSKIQSEKIIFGATISLIDESGNNIIYKIVGEPEADKKHGKISYKSPIGRALIGKEEGDIIIVKAPKGDIEYEIESISFK